MSLYSDVEKEKISEKEIVLPVSEGLSLLELNKGDEIASSNQRTNYLIAVLQGSVSANYYTFPMESYNGLIYSVLPPPKNRLYQSPTAVKRLISQKGCSIGEGDMFFVAANENVCLHAIEKLQCIIMSFDTFPNEHYLHLTFSKLSEKIGNNNRTYKIQMPPILYSFMEDMAYWLHSNSIPPWMEKNKRYELFFILLHSLNPNLVLSLLNPLLQKKSSFRNLVLENYKPNITTHQLIKISGMCRTNFYCTFKQEFGSSVHRWLQQQRAYEVYNSAQEEGMNVRTLMKRHRFSSASNFIRFCRMYYLCKPNELVRKVREGKSVFITPLL